MTKELGDVCRTTPKHVRQSALFQRERLGPKGPQGLVVRVELPCFCGATGNCTTILYAVQGDSYKRVFEDTMVRLVFLPAVHHLRFDIRTFLRFGGDREWVTLYRWDGKKYVKRETSCAIYSDNAARQIVPGECP